MSGVFSSSVRDPHVVVAGTWQLITRRREGRGEGVMCQALGINHACLPFALTDCPWLILCRVGLLSVPCLALGSTLLLFSALLYSSLLYSTSFFSTLFFSSLLYSPFFSSLPTSRWLRQNWNVFSFYPVPQQQLFFTLVSCGKGVHF